VEQLYACPFCRQLFTPGEVKACPECDIEVVPLAELPESHDATLVDQPLFEDGPEDETHSWTYLGRERGALGMLAALGIAVFFAPWLHETSPEIRSWSGFEFARNLAWIWAGGVAWFVMLPLILSRRTIRQMRGARVAVGFLAGAVLVTVGTRIAFPPEQHPLVPLRYSWGWGLYTSGFLALIALVLATRFGGSLADMPTRQRRQGDETIH
jgi:hypothetical protein